MKVEIPVIYLNIIKAIYRSPKVNIKLYGKKLTTFSLKSGSGQGCQLTLNLFHIVFEDIPRAVRLPKEIKRLQNEKEELNV